MRQKIMIKNALSLFLCAFVFIIFSCNKKITKEESNTAPSKEQITQVKEDKKPSLSPTEEKLVSLKLVNVQSLDSSILVSLKYATTDNFTKKVLYKDLKKAYLQPDVAAKLAKAQQILKEIQPGMRLLVYDAVRPLSVQKDMYELVKNTPYHRYVAEPGRTGLHNYGAAVDLTITGADSIPLDMGTPFDFFGKEAGISNEDALVQQGSLTKKQVENRRLLRKVMIQAGFITIRGEWWHFNACSLETAKSKYQLVKTF